MEIEDQIDDCPEEESSKKPSDVRYLARKRKPPMYHHNEYASIAAAKHTAFLVTNVELLPGSGAIICN